jgi:hypothetical protein
MIDQESNTLQALLLASIHQQLGIRLVKALYKYGACTPDCRLPCTCGWRTEAEALLAQAKARLLEKV